MINNNENILKMITTLSQILFRNAASYSRFLLIANIGRIMKKYLPDNAKIAKDAKETVQECISEFISFITSKAC